MQICRLEREPESRPRATAARDKKTQKRSHSAPHRSQTRAHTRGPLTQSPLKHARGAPPARVLCVFSLLSFFGLTCTLTGDYVALFPKLGVTD